MPPKKSGASQYIRQRNLCKENIKRIEKLIETRGESLSSTDLQCRLDILQTYFHDALENQTLIEELEHEPEMFNACQTRGKLEELYCQVKSQILQLISATAIVKPVHKYESSTRPENLPKLKVPVFTGKYADYPNFMHPFTTLVGKESRLTTVEKFNHLISCLSGNALRTVKSLDITEENYDKALSLLVTRYNNKYLMCEEHIESIFHLKKVSKGSADQLRMLVDTVTARFNALCSLNTYEEISNALVVYLALAALDTESQQKVEEAIDYTKSFSWDQCATVLSKRCQVLEARNPHSASESQKPSNKKSLAVSFNTTDNQCQLCKQQGHSIWKCGKFLELSPLQRYDAAKAAQLCINCLSAHHTVQQCKSSTCRRCNGRQHTLLHRGDIGSYNDQRENQQQQQLHQQNSSQEHQPRQPHFARQATNSMVAAAAADNIFVPTATADTHFLLSTEAGERYCHVSKDEPTQVDTQTILATVLVNIHDKHGNTQVARALLDSASQVNFITRSLVQKLNLAKNKTTTIVGGIGESQCRSKYSTNATLGSRHGEYSTSLNFVILPTITGFQPSCNINTNNWKIPGNLVLADPRFNIPDKVDLLLGADIFFELFIGNQMQLGKDLPMLLHTKFGWIVSGKYACNGQTPCALIAAAIEPDQNHELEKLVQHFC